MCPVSTDRPLVSGHVGGVPFRTGCGCLLAVVLAPLWLVIGVLPALVSDDVVGLALQVRWSLDSDEHQEPPWTEAGVPVGTPMSITTGSPRKWSCSIRQADGTWAPAHRRDSGFWAFGDETLHEFRAPTSPVAVRCTALGRKAGQIALWRDDAGIARKAAYHVGRAVAGLAWLGGVTVVLFGPWILVAGRRRRKRPASSPWGPQG
jgi:hypothetical protein